MAIRSIVVRRSPFDVAFDKKTDVTSSFSNEDYTAVDQYLQSIGLARVNHIEIEPGENLPADKFVYNGYIITAFALENESANATTLLSTVVDNFIAGFEGIVEKYDEESIFVYSFSDDVRNVLYHLVILAVDV